MPSQKRRSKAAAYIPVANCRRIFVAGLVSIPRNALTDRHAVMHLRAAPIISSN